MALVNTILIAHLNWFAHLKTFLNEKEVFDFEYWEECFM